MSKVDRIKGDMKREFALAPPPAQDFWSAFRLKAARVRREETGMLASWLPPVVSLRWAAAACVAVVLAVMTVVTMLPSAAPASGVVKSLDVVAPHDAVFILRDTGDKGTFIWIAGLQEGG